MKMIGRWTAMNVMYNPITYVFEQGSKYDKPLRRQFNEELREEDRNYYRIGSLTLGDKREAVPLQAADIFAYEAMKEIERLLAPTNRRAARESGKNLNRRESDYWAYCEKSALVLSYEDALRRRAAYPDTTPHTPGR